MGGCCKFPLDITETKLGRQTGRGCAFCRKWIIAAHEHSFILVTGAEYRTFASHARSWVAATAAGTDAGWARRVGHAAAGYA